MRAAVSLAAGARAAEELATALVGFNVSKAIDPLSHAGFLLIGEAVSAKLAKAVSGAEAKVIAEALDELDLDWATLSDSAVDAAIKAARLAVAASYEKRVLPKISDVFEVEGPSMMRKTRLSVIASEKIEIAAKLSQRDLSAEEAIRKSHLNFIRDSSGVRIEALSVRAREIVASGMSRGLGTDVIANKLRESLQDDVPRPTSYWRVVADAFVGRARTTSQINAYVDAGIESYEIVAVIDEVTTDICRFMDGRVFEVAAAKKLIDSLNEITDPEDVRYANPWVRKGADPEGGMRLYVPHADGTSTTIVKIARSGVGSRDDRGEFTGGKSEAELARLGIPVPPFHGRCRSTIVAA